MHELTVRTFAIPLVVWALAVATGTPCLAGPPGLPSAQSSQPAPPAQSSPPAINVADLPTNVVAWDATDRGAKVAAGEPTAKFSFALTNVSSEPVTLVTVFTSCGCTTAQLPPLPWKLESGSNGVINVTMNLAGKNGTVIKTVTVATDKGTKHLLVRTSIEPLPTSTAMPPGTREQNQMLAMADRQMVFRGDCANCHAEPAKGKLGQELYAAVCGVCHEAAHRANMVPDLKLAKQERNAEYWRNWIRNGRQGSLMPAFTVAAGGNLTEEQISSLVEHLGRTMPAKPKE